MVRRRLRQVGYILLYGLLVVGMGVLVLGALEGFPTGFLLGVLVAALAVVALLLPGPRGPR